MEDCRCRNTRVFSNHDHTAGRARGGRGYADVGKERDPRRRRDIGRAAKDLVDGSKNRGTRGRNSI